MSDETEELEVIEELVDKFKDKLNEDDSLEKQLKGYRRDIRIEMDSGNRYGITLNETEIRDIKREQDGSDDEVDIILYSDADTLRNLLNKEIGVMQAYAKNKIKIDAPLTDMLKIKKLL